MIKKLVLSAIVLSAMMISTNYLFAQKKADKDMPAKEVNSSDEMKANCPMNHKGDGCKHMKEGAKCHKDGQACCKKDCICGVNCCKDGKMCMANCKCNCAMIPNMTEEQGKKMKELKMKLDKESLPIENLIEEKKAHLKTLQSAEKPDMEAINKTIDEMSVLRASLEKLKAAHHQSVRMLLTEEQKIGFDKMSTKCKGKGKGKKR